jgi:hypothetical protein
VDLLPRGIVNRSLIFHRRLSAFVHIFKFEQLLFLVPRKLAFEIGFFFLLGEGTGLQPEKLLVVEIRYDQLLNFMIRFVNFLL